MTRLSLDLAEGADMASARAALERADAGPAHHRGRTLAVGPDVTGGERSYAATTSLGCLRADSVRAMLETGLVVRRWSPPAAAAWLWLGAPLGSVVEGVRLDREPARDAPRPPASRVEVEDALLDAMSGRCLLVDGSNGSRALAGLGRERGATLTSALLRWNAAADASPIGGGPTLNPARLDVPALFDAFVSTADAPTTSGFKSYLVEAMAARAGVASLVCATGAEALFAAGPDAGSACRVRRLALFHPRFRPATDPLDVERARIVEIVGLRRAPVHRISSIVAILPTQTRDAIACFGPREVPGGLARDAGLAALWSHVASLDTIRSMAGCPPTTRSRHPFVEPAVRDRVRGLAATQRFGRPGSGGLLARWMASGPLSSIETSGAYDGWLDGQFRGALGSRIESAIGWAAESPAFHGDAVRAALARFRAGTHGWTARRIAAVTFLAAYLRRERLAPFEPS